MIIGKVCIYADQHLFYCYFYFISRFKFTPINFPIMHLICLQLLTLPSPFLLFSLIIFQYYTQYSRMQIVTDPENYQTSEVVEKSNKSGFASNKRLLVIKSGFLNYFSNIPKNYKEHVPNILSTFKELPKSSIEIKAIQQIKMQSSNSSNLILTFYEKDMIEKQDIRKSISDTNYRLTKKSKEDLTEWKFTFNKVLNCRLWYTALLKLKAYFSKHEDKTEQYLKYFDPVKRNSTLPPMSKDVSGVSKFRASQIMTKFKEEDLQKEKQKQIQMSQMKEGQKKKQDISPQKKKPEQQQNSFSPTFPIAVTDQKLQTIREDDQIIDKKLEDDYREQIQEHIRKQEARKNEKLIEGMKTQLQAKNEKIKLLQQAIKATEKLKAKQEEARQRQRIKQKQRQLELQRQIDKQKQLQRKLEQQQRYNKKSIKQEADYTMVPPKRQTLPMVTPPVSVNLQVNRQAIQLHEFSVQTDGSEEQQIQPKGFLKRNNQSFISAIASTQRDTYTIFRNAGSLSFEFQQKEQSYQNYDYYTEVEDIQNPSLSFEDKIKKQIKLLNYVNKMKSIALDTLRSYIDTEHPKKSLKFNGTLFQINISCEYGKTININGDEKLVYSNQEHQRLKRQFKIYNYLQDMFIEMVEKRKKFPLRVPLCFFFQYRGYSALLKYLPYVKKIESSEQVLRIQRMLGKIVQEQNLVHYNLFYIANRTNNMYMVTVKNPYKVTQQSHSFEIVEKEMHGPRFLLEFRNKLVSSNKNYLQQQKTRLLQEFQDVKGRNKSKRKKVMAINQILLCRSLKKIFRSTQPFSYGINDEVPSDFLLEFLSNPNNMLTLVTDVQPGAINGLLISYFQHFFGIVVPSDFDIYNTNFEGISFEYAPTSRTFSFNSLYPNKLARNLQSYIISEKYDLVETAFTIINQLDRKDQWVEIYRIKYDIKKSSPGDIAISGMIKKLVDIKKSVDKHNVICLQIYMLMIQCQTLIKSYEECLATINQTLQYVAYMYGADYSDGGVQDYLYLLVAQTLAKMGHIDNSILVYKKLLSNKACTLTQQQICLSIAQVYNNFFEVEPSTLIQFLLSLLEQKQNSKQQKKKEKEKHVWQAKIKKFIGMLYQKINKVDLSIKYLQQSFSYYEENGVINETQVNDIVEMSLSLFNHYQRQVDKSVIFTKFIQLLEINSQNEKFSIHIFRMVRAFITSCFCHLVQYLQANERKNIREILEELRDQQPIIPQTVYMISYEDLEKTLKKISERSQLGTKQGKVIQLIDFSEVQTFILAME